MFIRIQQCPQTAPTLDNTGPFQTKTRTLADWSMCMALLQQAMLAPSSPLQQPRRISVAAAASAAASTPESTLFALNGGGIGGRFQEMIAKVQDRVCAAVEALDGNSFREDAWSRPGGGGGITRVLQDGNVWEKAGVSTCAVHGKMNLQAFLAATGDRDAASADDSKAEAIPFFATGISSVMHPKNPFAPTVHFNYRYFEAVTSSQRSNCCWWFGGGTDLTPCYVIEEDVKHFHEVQKRACDKFDPKFYSQFKRWCDDYFMIKHRGERRGVGGIFFDKLNDRDPKELLAFATECAHSVVDSYIPIVEKRKDTPFTQAQKSWQQLRRGRYVEFNLVCDQGTKFGFETGGRIESILMSLPLTAGWEYDHQPVEGTKEWELVDACRNPREWT